MDGSDQHPGRERLIKKLESIADLTGEERQGLRDLPMAVRVFEADRDTVSDGDRPQACCLILEGFVARYKMLPDGRRQILSFHTPGDIPDLQSLHLRKMDHGIVALARTTAAFINHGHMRELLRRHPGLTHVFWRDTLIDAAIFREWITNVGRRNAQERVAHLLCEMALRFQGVGLADNHCYEMPVTQGELADAMGLSAVHVNRVLQAMRRDGLISWQGNTVRLLDWERIQAACDFDPRYLHQDPVA